MTKKNVSLCTLFTLPVFGLTSCEGPAGTGAGYGAAAGAIIGAAATGNARGAALGAAAGAAAGALTGAAIAEDRARSYGPPPSGGWPYALSTGYPNIYRSPYTRRSYDLRDVPPGGLTRDVETGRPFRRPPY
ncbi:MAG: glycine zipper domain-containing protein [Verrucomicrobiota bacterium]